MDSSNNFKDWLGGSFGDSTPSNNQQSSRITNTAASILDRLGTAATERLIQPRQNSSNVSKPNTDVASNTTTVNTSQWHSFKERFKTQPEVKWSIIIVLITLIFGLAFMAFIMIGMNRRCKRDKDRYNRLLESFDKKPISLDQVRILSSPVDGGDSVSGTQEEILQSLPSVPGQTMGTSVQNTGIQLLADFEQATDTSIEMTPSIRHAMLLHCQSRLTWMDSVATSQLIKHLNGFDVIDMKLRINSAIQDLNLE